MQRILYMSDGSPDSFETDQTEVVALARRNNPELGIAGFLVAQGGIYVQILEGPSENLPSLMEYLATDHRHSGLRILRDEQEVAPRFNTWAMAHYGAQPQKTDLPDLGPMIETLRASSTPSEGEIDKLLDGMFDLHRALTTAR